MLIIFCLNSLNVNVCDGGHEKFKRTMMNHFPLNNDNELSLFNINMLHIFMKIDTI